MDEQNLAADFNELNSLARDILASVKADLEKAHSELGETQHAFGNTLRELETLKETKQNLSMRLVELQTAKSRLESELDYLRKEIPRLNALNQSLSANLHEARTAENNIRAELSALRGKIEQARRLLAG